MRSGSTYRGAKKRAAREKGVKFSVFNEHHHRGRVFAAHELQRKALTAHPQTAAKVPGIWAKNGGRATAISPAVTAEELDLMNAQGGLQQKMTPEQIEAAKTEAGKLTVADVDKAMERALTAHQKSGAVTPLVLNRLFAARARALGWVENVEFVEEK